MPGVEEGSKPMLSRLELAIVTGKSREVEGELGIMHDTRAEYARHARDIKQLTEYELWVNEKASEQNG